MTKEQLIKMLIFGLGILQVELTYIVMQCKGCDNVLLTNVKKHASIVYTIAY